MSSPAYYRTLINNIKSQADKDYILDVFGIQKTPERFGVTLPPDTLPPIGCYWAYVMEETETSIKLEGEVKFTLDNMMKLNNDGCAELTSLEEVAKKCAVDIEAFSWDNSIQLAQHCIVLPDGTLSVNETVPWDNVNYEGNWEEALEKYGTDILKLVNIFSKEDWDKAVAEGGDEEAGGFPLPENF